MRMISPIDSAVTWFSEGFGSALVARGGGNRDEERAITGRSERMDLGLPVGVRVGVDIGVGVDVDVDVNSGVRSGRRSGSSRAADC